MIISDEKDVVIEFSKKPIMHFFSEDNSSKYICTITFRDTNYNIIREIETTDIEIFSFIEALELFAYSREYFPEMFFLFNHLDKSMVYKAIHLTRGKSMNINAYDTKIYMRLCDYIDEQINTISIFKLNDNIGKFIDELYKNFIENNGNFYNKNVAIKEANRI